MFISPQGLSQAIQKLEQELNVKLFYREGNRLQLTQAGEEVYDLASEMNSLYRDMEDRLAQYRGSKSAAPQNCLHIVSAPMVNATFLPRVLLRLRKKNPSLRLYVEEKVPDQMKDSFDNSPHAVFIISQPELELELLLKDTPQALDFTEFYRSRCMACVSVNSPIAKRKSVSISEFERRHLVLVGMEDRLIRHIYPALEMSEYSFHTSNMQLCRSMLANDNDSIGLTNAITEKYMKNQALTALPLVPSTDMVYGYLAQPEYLKEPVVQTFLQMLREELREN